MSGSALIIREAAEEDVAVIVRMIGDLSRQEGDPDDLFDQATAATDLFGKSPWINGVVAEADGRLIGVALWHAAYEANFAARGGFVVSLWVEPAYRRRGVATRLIAAVAAAVDRIGGEFLWWASKPFNKDAHATYASLGAGQESVMAHALTGDRFRAMVRRSEEDR